jgi:hypothetical protein
MNSVDTRAPFFPRSKSAQTEVQTTGRVGLGRNSYDRIQELEAKTSHHAKVSIPDKIRDFSRIKKAVDSAPEIDNTDKIASQYNRLTNAFSDVKNLKLNYAVKALSNINILKFFKKNIILL